MATKKASGKKAARKGAKAQKASRKAAKGRTTKARAKAAPARRRPGALAGTLGMVTLHVHDIGRAAAFYRDVLGLRVGDVLETPEMGWVEVEVAPGVKLGLHADKGGLEEGARPPGGASGFYFVVPDVDAAIRKLRERGAKVVDEPTDRPYGRDAAIEDTEGNVLALLTPR